MNTTQDPLGVFRVTNAGGRGAPRADRPSTLISVGSTSLVTWLTPPSAWPGFSQPGPALVLSQAEDGGNEMVTREYVGSSLPPQGGRTARPGYTDHFFVSKGSMLWRHCAHWTRTIQTHYIVKARRAKRRRGCTVPALLLGKQMPAQLRCATHEGGPPPAWRGGPQAADATSSSTL